MNKHVHYDLAAYEQQIRAQFKADAANPTDEFHRLQLLGSEVVVQFGVFLARLDNEGVSNTTEVETACAVIASQVENLALGFEADRNVIIVDLMRRIAEFALRGGEVLSHLEAPTVEGGHA